MADLKEAGETRQVAGERRRRWFSSADMDLTVWFDEGDEIAGFELCYDKGKAEHSLRWKRGSGFRHQRVDDGEGRPDRYKATPVLVPDGAFDRDKITRQFIENSRVIDQRISEFVRRRLLGEPELS